MNVIERLETVLGALTHVKHRDLNIQAQPQMIHRKELHSALIEDLKKLPDCLAASYA